MEKQVCAESRIKRTGSRKLLPATVVILLAIAGFYIFTYFHNRHDLNAFMKERYGRFDPEKKYWVTNDDEPHYKVCASQDIKIHGEPHCMVAVCGEQPEELQSHATPGYVDLYVMKHT